MKENETMIHAFGRFRRARQVLYLTAIKLGIIGFVVGAWLAFFIHALLC